MKLFIFVCLMTTAVLIYVGYMIGENSVENHNHDELVKALRVYVNDERHTCADLSHRACNTECICDGMECWILKRDYEISIYMDTLWMWDGDSLIGRYITTWHNQIDTLILKDNQ